MSRLLLERRGRAAMLTFEDLERLAGRCCAGDTDALEEFPEAAREVMERERQLVPRNREPRLDARYIASFEEVVGLISQILASHAERAPC